MNLSGENAKTPHNEGGQNYAEKKQDEGSWNFVDDNFDKYSGVVVDFSYMVPYPGRVCSKIWELSCNLVSSDMPNGILFFCSAIYTTESR